MTTTVDEVMGWYEQAKRVLRSSLPADVLGKDPFILACHDCGLAFPMGADVGMVAQHAELAHGWTEGSVPLDLVFIGEGEPPKGAKR